MRVFNRVSIIAFSEKGYTLGQKILGFLKENSSKEVAEKMKIAINVSLDRGAGGSLSNWTAEHFYDSEALIYIGATGIAIRGISEYLDSKMTDPAVISIDELGKFVIPLLSGHVGGANELALAISNKLGSTPVITTATDINGVFAVDSWAKENGYHISNPEAIKDISATLLAGGSVRIFSEFKICGNLPKGMDMGRKITQGLKSNHGKGTTAGRPSVDISYKSEIKCGKPSLKIVPPVITAGIGCRKGVDEDTIKKVYEMALNNAGIHERAVFQICSIDIKAKELGLLKFCKSHGLPFYTYSAKELMQVEGEFTSSEFVKKKTGTDNVCERAAMLGSIISAGSGAIEPNEYMPQCQIVYRKFSQFGVTVAFSINRIGVSL